MIAVYIMGATLALAWAVQIVAFVVGYRRMPRESRR